MQRRVDGAIGDAEGALAEHGFQLITAQHRAGRQHTAQFGSGLQLAVGLIIGHHRLLSVERLLRSPSLGWGSRGAAARYTITPCARAPLALVIADRRADVCE